MYLSIVSIVDIAIALVKQTRESTKGYSKWEVKVRGMNYELSLLSLRTFII